MNGSERLVIDSATGVEVALPIAGPGGRAYAFVFDWHIRLGLALAWYGSSVLLQSLLSGGPLQFSGPFDPGPAWYLGVVVPTAAIFFLYHPILEIALRGQTPGKRAAGLRIVTRAGQAPSVGALLIRNVFRLVDSFPAVYCVGLVATLVTRENLRLGDLAAGTLLVYERDRTLALPTLGAGSARALAGAGVGAGAVMARELAADELAGELLARWPELATAARGPLARELLRRRGTPEATLEAADDATLQRLLAGHDAGAVP